MLSYVSAIKVALRLLRCALEAHDLTHCRGGLRCATCDPIRKCRKTEKPTVEEVPSV